MLRPATPVSYTPLQGVRFPFYVVVLMVYYLGYTCQCVVTKSAQSLSLIHISQSCQDTIGDQTAHRTDQHSLALTQTGSKEACLLYTSAMGEPTIAEFSRMMQISTPNAAYKSGSLVKKGYVEKIQSTTDRREYHLCPTQKYIAYYNISYSYLSTVIERVRKRFPEEDVDKLEQMLTIISDELMPELDLMNKTRQRLSE